MWAISLLSGVAPPRRRHGSHSIHQCGPRGPVLKQMNNAARNVLRAGLALHAHAA